MWNALRGELRHSVTGHLPEVKRCAGVARRRVAGHDRGTLPRVAAEQWQPDAPARADIASRRKRDVSHILVPTLRVGMPAFGRSASFYLQPVIDCAFAGDAERRRRHSRAERGNEVEGEGK